MPLIFGQPLAEAANDLLCASIVGNAGARQVAGIGLRRRDEARFGGDFREYAQVSGWAAIPYRFRAPLRQLLKARTVGIQMSARRIIGRPVTRLAQNASRYRNRGTPLFHRC